VPEVGDLVASGDPLLRVYSSRVDLPVKKILQCIDWGPERVLDQDPAFALRIIVDIAIKALSPGINDPTTAVMALDQIHTLLRGLGLRRLAIGLVYDSPSQLRFVYQTPNWKDFVTLALTEIRRCGSGSIQITRRIRAMLVDLIQSLPPCRHEQLQHELWLLDVAIDGSFAIPDDRVRARTPDSQGLGGRRRVA
jgi:uncharacterized membrane protein